MSPEVGQRSPEVGQKSLKVVKGHRKWVKGHRKWVKGHKIRRTLNCSANHKSLVFIGFAGGGFPSNNVLGQMLTLFFHFFIMLGFQLGLISNSQR